MAKDNTWKIREIEIPNRVVVAPMAGVSNMAFGKSARNLVPGWLSAK